MAIEKILKVGSSGFPEEFSPIDTSAGAGDAGKVAVLDSTGRFALSTMPVGIGAMVVTATASENLAAGDFVNLHLDTTLKARKADASGGIAKKADGFVIGAVTSGQPATVYLEGANTGCSGLTIGTDYFLSATPGVPTATPPTTAAHICQYLGKAVSATEITTEIGDPIIRA